jgi:hypothetical protein
MKNYPDAKGNSFNEVQDTKRFVQDNALPPNKSQANNRKPSPETRSNAAGSNTNQPQVYPSKQPKSPEGNHYFPRPTLPPRQTAPPPSIYSSEAPFRNFADGGARFKLSISDCVGFEPPKLRFLGDSELFEKVFFSSPDERKILSNLGDKLLKPMTFEILIKLFGGENMKAIQNVYQLAIIK